MPPLPLIYDNARVDLGNRWSSEYIINPRLIVDRLRTCRECEYFLRSSNKNPLCGRGSLLDRNLKPCASFIKGPVSKPKRVNRKYLETYISSGVPKIFKYPDEGLELYRYVISHDKTAKGKDLLTIECLYRGDFTKTGEEYRDLFTSLGKRYKRGKHNRVLVTIAFIDTLPSTCLRINIFITNPKHNPRQSKPKSHTDPSLSVLRFGSPMDNMVLRFSNNALRWINIGD